jgi:hypothetical protein
MSICDSHPELREMLSLLVQAQLASGHTFFLADMSSDFPEPAHDVDTIIDAICGEQPILRFPPKEESSRHSTDDAE